MLDQLLAGADDSGLSYDRAVSLLGYTDDSLLDEIVEAFAASDGAAVFGVVNRVIEGGHEPRRFAADLLDRLRDLIVLAAVPDAAETGLLDLPPDGAERMAGQAAKFGRVGLTRAAEIISTGLDQMRGATSPRLLLELMCAQVLLPAATADEASLLTRLERLEQGMFYPNGRYVSPAGTAAFPTSGGGRPRRRPPGRPIAAPRPRRASPARRRARAPAPARGRPGPARCPSGGSAGSPADSLRAQWPQVLDAVKRERRVAWMILSNASVQSLADGVLTLRFSRDGDLKGFGTSGCDADLKRVLSTGFGINVQVKGVAGTEAPPSQPGQASLAAEPQRRRDPTPQVAGPPPADSYEPDEPDDDGMPPRPPELTGMDLIQRELGGQIISEIDA